MQANNQINYFMGGGGGVFTSSLSHGAVNFLLLFSGSMEKAKPPKDRSFHVTNKFFICHYYIYINEGL